MFTLSRCHFTCPYYMCLCWCQRYSLSISLAVYLHVLHLFLSFACPFFKCTRVLLLFLLTGLSCACSLVSACACPCVFLCRTMCPLVPLLVSSCTWSFVLLYMSLCLLVSFLVSLCSCRCVLYNCLVFSNACPFVILCLSFSPLGPVL
jgi:hypothetical protein